MSSRDEIALLRLMHADKLELDRRAMVSNVIDNEFNERRVRASKRGQAASTSLTATAASS
jgi:hypothetical protein